MTVMPSPEVVNPITVDELREVTSKFVAGLAMERKNQHTQKKQQRV